MKRNNVIMACMAFSLMLLMASCQTENGMEESEGESAQTVMRADYAIAIHGGAGTILRENMSPEMEEKYKDALNRALDIGENILKDGGSSVDAVEQTIIYLENIPLFNAGKGSVFTHEGKNELDACIMRGSDLNAGAVAGMTNIKNPIRAARAVMENSKHVMLSGRGAEQFAEEQGIETVEPSYFYTEMRWEALQRAREAEEKEMGYRDAADANWKYGTVGCVALDKDGKLTAGTSTGGMTNKRYNRIGDVPIIGGGTYANDNTCAVSCTGHGEFFIRYTVGHDVSALMEYRGMKLAEAADLVINEKLVEAGGSGGLIAVDRYGNVAMPLNTPGMYRGYAKPGEREVAIYKNE